MDLTNWIIPGWIIPVCFVWMVIGVFVLGIASDKLKKPHLFDIYLLFAWPVVLFVAIKTHRYVNQNVNQNTPQPVNHRLHQPKLIIGAEGKTLTALQPNGKIEVEGIAHDAQVQHGFVEAGVKVVVCGTYMNHTMVKRVD